LQPYKRIHDGGLPRRIGAKKRHAGDEAFAVGGFEEGVGVHRFIAVRRLAFAVGEVEGQVNDGAEVLDAEF